MPKEFLYRPAAVDRFQHMDTSACACATGRVGPYYQLWGQRRQSGADAFGVVRSPSLLWGDPPGKPASTTHHHDVPTRKEMPTTAKTRRMNGGHAVADCLCNEGVRHVFNVPGESF